MKKGVNRYTMNFVVGNRLIPYAHSDIENIDRLSTNFDSKSELLNYIEGYANIDFLADDIVVTYNNDKQVMNLELLFNNFRSIVSHRKLVGKIVTFLNRYENTQRLDISSIHNKFLRNLLYTLLEQRTSSDYQYRLEKIREHLYDQYKLTRDFAIAIDTQLKERGKIFLEAADNDEKDLEEVLDCLDMMPKSYVPNKPMPYEVPKAEEKYIDTGDEYLDALLANHDYDAISRRYDLDTLEALGVHIFDGTRDIAKEKGRTR